MVQAFRNIIDKALPVAFGPLGEPGDPELIEYVAHALGDLHQKAVDWALAWMHMRCSGTELEPLLALLPELLGDLQSQIAGIPERIDRAIEDGLATLSKGSMSYSGELTITVRIPDDVLERIQAETKRLAPFLRSLYE